MPRRSGPAAPQNGAPSAPPDEGLAQGPRAAQAPAAPPENEAAAVWVPVGALHEWGENPRRNTKAVPEVARSIKRFGFGAPILARRNGEIIAGHTRFEAAKQIGLERVPVRYLDLDPAEAHVLALADNKLGEIAEWDDAKLAALVAQAKADNVDLTDGTGFGDAELDRLARSVLDESQTVLSPPRRATGTERWEILQSDVLLALKALPSSSFDAVLSDVPYGLGSKEPTAAELASYLLGGDLDTGGDFLGHDWQVPSVAVWRELLRVLKPGAPVLAFAGSRTHDLVTVGIRAGGFEIGDLVMWIYAQGMPKPASPTEVFLQAHDAPPETSLAAVRRWAGYGQALKPAFEPVTLAWKPYEKTIADNILKHDVGALNVVGCRVGREAMRVTRSNGTVVHSGSVFQTTGRRDAGEAIGRWPANLLLSHNERCSPGACVDGCPVLLIDQQSAGASRCFYHPKVDREEREAGCESFPLMGVNDHTVRPEQRDHDRIRNIGPCLKPISLTRYLAQLLLPPVRLEAPRRLLVPYCGTGSEVIGAVRAGWDAVVGIERDPKFAELARQRLLHWDSVPAGAEDETQDDQELEVA